MTDDNRLVSLMVCCNNRHGRFIDRATALEFEAPSGSSLALDGDARFGDARFLEDCKTRFIRIARGRTPFVRMRSYVGNILWNRYWLTPDAAAELLNRLRASGRWSPHTATVEPVNLWEKWDDGEPFVGADFEGEMSVEEVVDDQAG